MMTSMKEVNSACSACSCPCSPGSLPTAVLPGYNTRTASCGTGAWQCHADQLLKSAAERFQL
jgi:hypothetical protein